MTAAAPPRRRKKMTLIRYGQSYALASARYRNLIGETRHPFGTRQVAQSEAKHKAVGIRDLWRRRVKQTESPDLALLVGDKILLFQAKFHARSRYAETARRPEPPSPSSRVVAEETFTGRVDNIRNGVAYLTLLPEDKEPLAAQWDADDLAKKSIGKSDLFELTMKDSGDAVTLSFRRTPRHPIPDDLWAEIQKLTDAYSDLLTDKSDGHGE